MLRMQSVNSPLRYVKQNSFEKINCIKEPASKDSSGAAISLKPNLEIEAKAIVMHQPATSESANVNIYSYDINLHFDNLQNAMKLSVNGQALKMMRMEVKLTTISPQRRNISKILLNYIQASAVKWLIFNAVSLHCLIIRLKILKVKMFPVTWRMVCSVNRIP